MFSQSLVSRCMPVGVACKVMGFRTPPTAKRDLKKRFVELAKKHHPDQNQSNVEVATNNMVKLTEAYKTLKALLDDGVQRRTGAATAAGGAGASTVSSHVENMEAVAASFRAPGSSLSLRGFTLPWQRYATQSAMAEVDATLNSEDASFDAYVSSARAKARAWRHREARIQADAPLSEGSHGFTADYFQQVHQVPDSARDGCSGTSGMNTECAEEGGKGRAAVDTFWASRWRTSTPYLAWRFYSRRAGRWASHAPRRTWEAVRFIFHG